MSTDNATIARPYAQAVLDRAIETVQLDLWSEMLDFMAEVVSHPQILAQIEDPKVDRSQLEALLVSIGQDHLDGEGNNFLRLLVQNKRLALISNIAQLYAELKRAHQGSLHVKLASAFAVTHDQEEKLREILSKRFGREVSITAEEDPSLIAGIKIRVGDMVIDHSLQGQLQRLASELGI